ncbi:MAG TPA: ABC transporter permease [Bryobacteraceae bacterium]|nr:ABC transporter permease [Bryobacteraceae bacterium]
MPARWLAIALRSLSGLRRFPLRSGLAILSAALGVAGAVSSMNYALGGRQRVTDQLARLGTNVLIVTPNASRSVGGRARTGALVTTLTPGDYASILKDVPLFERSSAFSTRSFPLKAGDLAKTNCPIVGVEPDYMAIKNWSASEGSVFNAADLRRVARVAVLGSSAAKNLFGTGSPVGKRIQINRVPFVVTGVLSERGQSLDAANEDDQVYIPLSTAMRRLANVDYYSGILFAVQGWENMDRAAAATRSVLSRRHRTIGKLPEDFSVQNQKQLLDTQIAASGQLLFFVRWIGFSALSVSGLGVLAIAWIGVRERTREIGTRRALGATSRDIFWQVAFESAMLSLLGCIAGMAAAAVLATLLSRWLNQPRVFDQASARLAVAVAMTLNLGFSAIPARTAAKLDPIHALRFE